MKSKNNSDGEPMVEYCFDIIMTVSDEMGESDLVHTIYHNSIIQALIGYERTNRGTTIIKASYNQYELGDVGRTKLIRSGNYSTSKLLNQ